MIDDPITLPVPGAKLRTMITDVQAIARTKIPHALLGGKGNKIDEVCEFALFVANCLQAKIKEIASRRSPGGYPMWAVIRKSLGVTDNEAMILCTRFGYDPSTTVRDREGK